ncbi:hypothetical protein UCRPA7_6198 [Phaeoacremonium minimum UCRPA7]|uniref:2EXR domain-containing protein n=1 Tax=Phaeoacremonium minimum (strain UCR-PA7) TaxID=1286976 RepID=R8BG64_PHAM7|nr:hypothetical protein UCRPA7_6198 [Phaeoacremonium minimum UCRPA7]EON98282.1 hypothetical protein UCRPA7_6198 [Phaeoacremonium minimum UCRPA7]
MVTTFGDLPVEIREAIYQHTLEDTPEVWVLSQRKDDAEWPPAPHVLTGFPTIMRICYESRAVALKHVRLAKLPLENGSQLLVPCRKFRPEFDYMYADSPLEALTVRILPDHPTVIFRSVQHMAFPADAVIRNWKSLYRHFRKFTTLKDVSIVFGPHYGPSPGWLEDEEDEPSLGFGGHCGHYRLTKCPEAGLRLRVDSQTTTPAKKTIAGMRRDVDVITRLGRLVYQNEGSGERLEQIGPLAIKTMIMARLGKFFGDVDIQTYVQPMVESSRS